MRRVKGSLREKYETVPRFNEYLRMFHSLALIPTEHIDAAFDHLKGRAGEFNGDGYRGLGDWLSYVETVCFHSTVAYILLSCVCCLSDLDPTSKRRWLCK